MGIVKPGSLLLSIVALGCGSKSGLRDPNSNTNSKCEYGQVLKNCKDGWCRINPGCFRMGDTNEVNCDLPEVGAVPSVQVTLTHAFEIMQHEVTQAEYETATNHNPVQSTKKIFNRVTPKACSNCPVYYLNWTDAASYCDVLSAKRGLPRCTKDMYQKDIYSCPGYRLPTEAEWEYAYRGGTSTPFYNGQMTGCSQDQRADAIGWYLFSHYPSPQPVPQPVGKKKDNPWGVHDMAGNVMELVFDEYQDHSAGAKLVDPVGRSDQPIRHVAKGGSVLHQAGTLRAAWREPAGTLWKSHGAYGVRCARTLH
jgi:formylglycine-generating enzyme required for sulfatase activity